MSDTPLPPEPSPDPPGAVAPEHDVEVDLAAFLPEGTELAADAWPREPADAWPAESADLTEEGDIEAVTAVEPEETSPVPPVPLVTSASEAPREPPVDLAALGQIEADLGAVDGALVALDQGRYGTCTACDEPIDDALLAADPVRTTCERHTPA